MIVAVAATMLAVPASAHGLLMKLRGADEAVVGELYYSNGQRAAGEWVELVDRSAEPRPPRTVQTEPDGSFRIPAAPGRDYLVRAHGEEGHTIEMELTLAPEARGVLIDDHAEGEAEDALPPAWMLIGGALLLSTIPALVLRRRATRSAMAATEGRG